MQLLSGLPFARLEALYGLGTQGGKPGPGDPSASHKSNRAPSTIRPSSARSRHTRPAASEHIASPVPSVDEREEAV
jgi:hypothetical protein